MIEPFLTKFQGNYFKEHQSKYISLIRLNFLALKQTLYLKRVSGTGAIFLRTTFFTEHLRVAVS